MRIPVVDEQDNLIRYKDRKERTPGEIIRVSALWLTDSAGNILLAQRAKIKKDSPGLWGPAVAGTVEEGETYESNIIKEAEEEIGLVGVKFTLGPKVRRSTTHEYFAQWFLANLEQNYPLKKQDQEVEELRWFSREELNELLKEKPEIFLTGFEQYNNLFK